MDAMDKYKIHCAAYFTFGSGLAESCSAILLRDIKAAVSGHSVYRHTLSCPTVPDKRTVAVLASGTLPTEHAAPTSVLTTDTEPLTNNIRFQLSHLEPSGGKPEAYDTRGFYVCHGSHCGLHLYHTV